MSGPLSRQMPCPDCGHDHLHLPCDRCACTAVTIPGIYPEETPWRSAPSPSTS